VGECFASISHDAQEFNPDVATSAWPASSNGSRRSFDVQTYATPLFLRKSARGGIVTAVTMPPLADFLRNSGVAYV